jgi:proline- and glutamine-rich splicing factor
MGGPNMRGKPGNKPPIGIGLMMKTMKGTVPMSIPGPTTNLPNKETDPKKTSGRCRLFIGNLTPDVTEEQFKNMFNQYGELSEVFLNAQKGFGFVKMDKRENAEAARAALDGIHRNGRTIRVRFATHCASLRVRNLSPWVSNELLEKAFSIFGEVERAVVIVDERGKPIGEGIVEFARKPGAQQALKRCIEGCFLLTSSPRPVVVEPLDHKDEEDGHPEKVLPKTNQQYIKEREIGPRFAHPNTFEYEFANKWKQLYEVEKQKRELLEKEVKEDRDRLEDQMEFSLYEYETNMLREKLRQREQDANNLLREREMRRRDQDRMRDDQKRQEEMMRQQQEEFLRRNDDMRRRQEDNLLIQANHLSTLLDKQEAAIRQIQGGGGGGGGGGGNMMGGMNNNRNSGHMGNYGPGGGMGGGPLGNSLQQLVDVR